MVNDELAMLQSTTQVAPLGGNQRVKSSDLLKSGRELVIEHNGQEYRLLRTSNNKLLLVK